MREKERQRQKTDRDRQTQGFKRNEALREEVMVSDLKQTPGNKLSAGEQ